MPQAMREESASTRVSRISGDASARPSWTLAVFAHNEGGRIRRALERVAAAAGGEDIEVWVLANGCTDSTTDEVRACAHLVPHLWLAEIAVTDKANAWNVYVHELVTPARLDDIEIHFFTDGDVTLERDALAVLASALGATPSAKAAGGMPATGRSRTGWRERMVENGMLAGNLYALRASVVKHIRQQQLRIPVGLIGEDIFLSWIVASEFADRHAGTDRGAACIFCPAAEFSFRSLSPLRPGDYRTYLRRKWRYARRALQLEMLRHVLARGGLAALPRHVHALYLDAPLPSRLRWVGLDTPLRLAAVLGIRRFRRRSQG
jgi:glycosyltransferase involved in cell wall biosynthesis